MGRGKRESKSCSTSGKPTCLGEFMSKEGGGKGDEVSRLLSKSLDFLVQFCALPCPFLQNKNFENYLSLKRWN